MIPPLPPVYCSPLFAVVRTPQQNQGLAPKNCTLQFAGVPPDRVTDRGFCPWVRRTVFPGGTMAGRFKPLDVERQTKPGKYADGGGLYLIVTGPTSKSWSYRYWKDGKERWHGLGSLKDVSLKDARLARDAARLRVKGDRSTAGVDIVQERRKAREEAKAVEAKVVLPTFEECAEAYIRTNWSTWSEKHRDQWPSSLKRYVYPTIGMLTIQEIKPSHIHDLLKPIWVEKRETANRVRGRIETIIAKNVESRLPQSGRAYEAAARKVTKAPQAGRPPSSGLTVHRGACIHEATCRCVGHSCRHATLPNLHGLPHERGGRRALGGDRSPELDLENPR